jgi:HSP20 family protein
MPGVDPQHVQITVQGDTLTIRGETNSEINEPQTQQGRTQAQTQGQPGQGATGQSQQGQTGNYLMRERRQAVYFRQVTLPTNINPDKAQAHFEHGELILTLPKAEEAKPKQIRVQSVSPEGQITSGSQQRPMQGQMQGQTGQMQGQQPTYTPGSQTSQYGQQNERPQTTGTRG